jgi:hypothetical protein
MTIQVQLSLTPNFSWVIESLWVPKPFQRFSGRTETVETVRPTGVAAHTWLKPGVNESRFPISTLHSYR